MGGGDGGTGPVGCQGLRPLGLVVVGLAAALILAPGCSGEGPRTGTTDPDHASLERLQRETRLLGMEVELASGGQPYLVLDLPARVMTLRSHGAVLREYSILEASVRSRRLASGRDGGAQVGDTVWAQARLLPPVRRERVVILADTVTPPDPSGSVAYIPPTSEEEVPTPPSFRIHYRGGLSLRVAPGSGEGAPPPPALPARFLHWLWLRPWRPDRFRLEVVLPPGEAGALYRSFADGTPLLVVGPVPGPGAVLFLSERK